MRSFKLIFFAIISLFLCAPTRALATENIVVFDFSVTGSTNNVWIGPALTDYTIKLLDNSPEYNGLSRGRLRRLINRWKPTVMRPIPFETKDLIREHVGAALLLEGSVNIDRNGISFTGTVSNLEKGDIHDLSFSNPTLKLSDFQKSISDEISSALGVTLSNSGVFGTSNSSAYQDYWKAVIAFESGDTVTASKLLKSSIASDPSFTDAQVISARMLLENAKYNDALEIFKRLEKENAGNADIHFWLGLTYFFQRQFSNAASEIKIALEYDPDNPEYIHQLGQVHKSSGAYSEAVNSFASAVKIDATLYDAWYQIASIVSLLPDMPETASVNETRSDPPQKLIADIFSMEYAGSYPTKEEVALYVLRNAVKWGGDEIKNRLRNDADFNWIRNDPRFKILLFNK